MAALERRYLEGKYALVTGGFGFVGSVLVKELLNIGVTVKIIDNLSRGKRERVGWRESARSGYPVGVEEVLIADLKDHQACVRACRDVDVVFHLAAPVGGLYWSMTRHYEMFAEAMLTTVNIMNAAIKSPSVDRVALASSACAYSAELEGPHDEALGMFGTPEPSSEGYGWAKRMSEYMARWAIAEHGVDVAVFRPANAIGPDDIDDDSGHVIPQVLKRIFDGNDPLVIYGSGRQKREFMSVLDYARGAMAICERAADGHVVNLGSGHVVTISDLVERLLRLCEERGVRRPDVVYDTSYVDGHPSKFHSLTRLREEVGYQPVVSLEESLKEIVDDYAGKRSAAAV